MWRPGQRRQPTGILPFWADRIGNAQRMILRRLQAQGPTDRTAFHAQGLLALVNRRLISIVAHRVHLTEEGMDVATGCVIPVPKDKAVACPVCGRIGDRTDPWERRWIEFHAAEHVAGRQWYGRDPREEPTSRRDS